MNPLMTPDEYYEWVQSADANSPKTLSIALKQQRAVDEELSKVKKAVELNEVEKVQLFTSMAAWGSDYFVNRPSEENEFRIKIKELDADRKPLLNKWNELEDVSKHLVGSITYFKKSTIRNPMKPLIMNPKRGSYAGGTGFWRKSMGMDEQKPTQPRQRAEDARDSMYVAYIFRRRDLRIQVVPHLLQLGRRAQNAGQHGSRRSRQT